MLRYNKEDLIATVSDRAPRSHLYPRLKPDGRVIFEDTVLAYAATILDRSPTRSIKFHWKLAARDSGAERLLEARKPELIAALGVKPSALTSAIRAAAREALFVMVDPKAYPSVDELHIIKNRNRRVGKGEVSRGRQFQTDEVQPPSTGPRTLLRKK